ncbi:MAG: CapA family protein [Vallitaleaceae bacterium]|jgi:poly-gamma-glutamate capsule biosynthesis protein CapA/YwtB (metallophosphatase superfamily)|nr:CapA family protein [Vallitaleaceae bacterium]
MKRSLIIVIILITLTGCSTGNQIAMSTYLDGQLTHTESTEYVIDSGIKKVSDNIIIEHDVSEISILAVGDLMFHRTQLVKSYNSTNDTFDFSSSFDRVAPYLLAADYTIGNLETTLAGANGARSFRVDQRVGGYSGFPAFNSPDIIVDQLMDVGFDMVSTANNHSLDSYDEGLFRTIDVLDEKGLAHVGTYKTEEDSNDVFIAEVEGISFAFVNYTYGMNGFWPEEGHEYIINELNVYEEAKIEEMYKKTRQAKAAGVDFVIVMMHFGNEYFETENSYQRDVVDGLFDNGADVIFGGHPHVLQPIDVRDIERADGTTKKGVVIYSLGNFISSQRYGDGAHKDLGVMMSLNFTKTDEFSEISGITLVPTYTYWTDGCIGIMPVDETLSAYYSGNKTLTAYEISRLEYAADYTVAHLTSYIEEYEVLYSDFKHYISLD